MSFRGRLRLFFALIVIVPTIALGVVLFALTARTETGKADAGINAGMRAAVGAYQEDVARAGSRLRAAADARGLRRAVGQVACVSLRGTGSSPPSSGRPEASASRAPAEARPWPQRG